MKKIDIWALGIILYKLVYGVYPFIGSTSEMLKSMKNGPKISNTGALDTSLPYNVKMGCSEIIDKMLSYDPEKRPNI